MAASSADRQGAGGDFCQVLPRWVVSLRSSTEESHEFYAQTFFSLGKSMNGGTPNGAEKIPTFSPALASDASRHNLALTLVFRGVNERKITQRVSV